MTLNIINYENPQNNLNNQSSSINPQFINKKREKMLEVKNKNQRNDNKRREYFWAIFSFLMDYISKEFGLEFNLNFQKQFEAIYGCTIQNMKKVLSFKIYEIISLFKNTKLTEKCSTIIYAYIDLKNNSPLYQTFVFLMECTYDQLLEYYFTNNTEPKINVNISSFIQKIKKDKNEIMNVIREIKTKKGRKERKGVPLVLDESMTSFRNFEQKFLEKDDKNNIINNFFTNRLTNYTTEDAGKFIICSNKSDFAYKENNFFATDEFNFLNNRDMDSYELIEKVNSFPSLNQNLANIRGVNAGGNSNVPSPIPLNRYNFDINDNDNDN